MSLLIPQEDVDCPGCQHRLSAHKDNGCVNGCTCPKWWAEGLIHEKFKSGVSHKVENKPLLVSFYGPSGVGKSTCFSFAKECLDRKGFVTIRLDAALPLRSIQQYCYAVFGLEGPGRPELPDDFKQDGKLLEFLAGHFENRLGPIFQYNYNKTIGAAQSYTELQKTPLAIINTDCRNNCYTTLKALGFVFIRVDAPNEILAERKRLRGDLTPFSSNAAVESISEMNCRYTINNSGGLATLATRVFSVINTLTAR